MDFLGQVVNAAQENNAKKLATQIAAPKHELDTEALLLLRHFVEWARQRGVKYCPAAPASVAAFVRSEAAIGVLPERILAGLHAIEVAHDNAGGLANPVATGIVRAELSRIFKLDGPRSWSKSERLIFAGLPLDAQQIIQRHAKLDSDAVRRAQNQLAELRKQIQPKEIENVTTDQKTA